MTTETEAGCARPTGGPVDEKTAAETSENGKSVIQIEEVRSMVMVGRKAPNFSAPGYLQGKFINVKLSDYLGKWVVLCFYPGDFTFV